MPSVEELVAKAIQNGYTEAAAAVVRLEELLAKDESFETYATGAGWPARRRGAR